MSRSSSPTATGAELEIRFGGPEDTGRILELVKASLGEGSIPRDPAYWEWKHNQNPFGTSPVLLAESEGKLVGLRVFMRWDWEAAGQTFRAVRAVDTATHPDWQGKGIFRKLTLSLVDEVRQQGTAFVFNTPNEQSRPGYLKMGWSSLGRTPLWIRPNRPIRLWKRFRAGRVAEDDSPQGDSLALVAGFAPASALLAERELPALLDQLSDADPRLKTRLTPAYLQWRYVDVPGFDYYAAWEFQRAGGAALLFRLKPRGDLLELRICDIVVGPGWRSGGLARKLLRDVSRRSGADFVSAMAGRTTPQERVLWGAGLLPAPRTGPILTVLPLNVPVDGPDALRWASWCPSIGALELF